MTTATVAALGGLAAAATPWPWGIAVAALTAAATWLAHRAVSRATGEACADLPAVPAPPPPPRPAEAVSESPLVARLDVDPAGHIVGANALAGRLLGGPVEALRDRPLSGYLPGLLDLARGADAVLRRRWTLRSARGAVTVETAIHRRADGGFTLELVDVDDDARALADARAEQRQTQVATAARERLLRAYGVAVRARAGDMTELIDLLDGEALSADLQSPLAHARAASRSLLTVTDDILALTRADDDTDAAFDPLDLVEEVVRGRARAASDPTTWLIATDGAVERPLIGHATALRRVLDNLATHAAALSRSGRVEVRVSTPADPDTGQPGMVVSLQQAGPARRFGDGSWTGPAGGEHGGLGFDAGLELYVARALAAPLGGDVRVTDDPMRGPRIVVTCPLFGPALATPTTRARLDGLRVALCLGREEESAAISDSLTAHGATVSRATKRPAHAVDVLVTDAPFDGRTASADSPRAVVFIGDQAPRGAVDARIARPVAPSELIARVTELGRRTRTVEPGPTEPSVRPRPTERGRALLVDDDGVNQLIAARMLEDLGFGVTVSSDGVRALAAARAGGFDVVLLDWHLPGLDGLEVTRRLRASGDPGAAVPVIALTGRTMPEDIAACEAAGMDAHVAKPLTRAHLAEALARCVPGDGGSTTRGGDRPATAG